MSPRGWMPGLAWRFFLALLLGACLPLLLLEQRLSRESEDALRRLVRDKQLALLYATSLEVKSELRQAQETLARLTALVFDARAGEETQRLSALQAQLESLPSFVAVAGYRVDGTRWFTLGEPSAAPFPAELPAWVENPTGPSLGDVLAEARAPALALAHGYADARGPQGVLLAYVSLEGLCLALKRLAADQLDLAHETLFVLDEQQRMVAHPEPARAALLESRAGMGVLQDPTQTQNTQVTHGLAMEYREPTGELKLGVLQTLEQPAWRVVVELSGERIQKPLEETRRRFITAAGGVALLGLGLAALLARGITAPLRRLVSSIRRLATRDFTARVPVESRDELGLLAQSFNHMAEALQTSEEALAREQKIRADLSRFMSPEVVEELIRHPERIRLGGERRVVTVMFADIAGFLRLAEQLPPETLVTMLNELFTIGTEIILRHGGIIDKFIGDCIMSVFGVPEAKEDHALRAVRAAEDLMRWLETGNRRWEQVYGVRLELTIGIHTGPVVAGNVGSEKRMDYTVIGDTVNIASRLEGLARPGQILLSEATRQALGDEVEVEAAGLHTVSGRSGATLVFSVKEEGA